MHPKESIRILVLLLHFFYLKKQILKQSFAAQRIIRRTCHSVFFFNQSTLNHFKIGGTEALWPKNGQVFREKNPIFWEKKFKMQTFTA